MFTLAFREGVSGLVGYVVAAYGSTAVAGTEMITTTAAITEKAIEATALRAKCFLSVPQIRGTLKSLFCYKHKGNKEFCHSAGAADFKEKLIFSFVCTAGRECVFFLAENAARIHVG